MKYVIGIDLGGTKINAAIIDEQGNIFDKISMPSYGGQGKEAGSVSRSAVSDPWIHSSFTFSPKNLA